MRLNCCRAPKLDTGFTDLGSKDSFEFMLGRCKNCGAYWMNVFCVASNTTGYHRVSDEIALKMFSMPFGPERKAFVSDWFWDQN